MVTCAKCERSVPAEQIKPSVLNAAFDKDDVVGRLFLSGSTMPNVMEELAMKCNGCGTWICFQCVKAVGMTGGIQHSECGGMFETA